MSKKNSTQIKIEPSVVTVTREYEIDPNTLQTLVLNACGIYDDGRKGDEFGSATVHFTVDNMGNVSATVRVTVEQ